MSKSMSYVKTLSISAIALSVSACSSMPQQNGVIATDISGTFSQMWSNIFTGKLRSAPQQEYSFHADDASLNTHLLVRNLSKQAYARTVAKPHFSQNFEPRRPAQSQPVHAAPDINREAYPAQGSNQETGESLSYVKMGGGSQISDWQICEKQAGGYFKPTMTGFIVEPGFDSCMRTLGYKPESEAEAELSAQARS